MPRLLPRRRQGVTWRPSGRCAKTLQLAEDTRKAHAVTSSRVRKAGEALRRHGLTQISPEGRALR
jgi:hypothetical protein